MQDFVRRFLLEDLDIRGALVRLGPVWRDLQAGRGYPSPAARLLGEMTAVTVLLGGNLKQPGRLTFQLRSQGPVSMLVIDCGADLGIRGMARTEPAVAPAPVPDLLGHGHLMLTLDLPLMREPYQSFVPLEGESIAAIFENYLEQSEQQPSRLFLAAGENEVAGLFLQKLPGADFRDADGWARVEQLASTVRDAELLDLDAETLLGRLFAEETVRLFDARPVYLDCPDDPGKVRRMIESLGRHEAEAILAEHGEIVVRDEICNREYRFDADDVAAIFAPEPPPTPTMH